MSGSWPLSRSKPSGSGAGKAAGSRRGRPCASAPPVLCPCSSTDIYTNTANPRLAADIITPSRRRAGSSGTPASPTQRRWRASSPVGQLRHESERERLRPPVYLAAAVRGYRLDRAARQRVIGGEEPSHRLDVAEAAVAEQRERALQAPDDLIADEESGRHAEGAVGALDADQLAVAEHLLDPAHGHSQALSKFRNGQPSADGRVGRGVNLCHVHILSPASASAKPELPR